MKFQNPVVKKFSRYSMILSFTSCNQQMLHLDALLPNYQFVLSCNSNSPITICQPVPIERGITLVKELQYGFLRGIDIELFKILNYNLEVQDLVYDYGNLFTIIRPSNPLKTPEEVVELGTVVSLPGSVIHAGPKCNEPRAIIFFTCGFIWKRRKRSLEGNEDKLEHDAGKCKERGRMFRKVDLYSEYVQFNVVTLIIEIIISVWGLLQNPGHKNYLLNKLHELILDQKIDAMQHGPKDTYVPALDHFLQQCKNKIFDNLLLHRYL
jgi:hypothetical protein